MRKKRNVQGFLYAYIVLIALLIMSYTPLFQQSARDKKVIADGKDSKIEFSKGDTLLKAKMP